MLMARKRESIFHFKQFSIKNDLSAMKVGTDGVLLGAWCNVSNSTKILDIGSGTGLISLMLAQRCNAPIIGVEIELNAVSESIYNINNSKWCDRITVKHGDILDLTPSLASIGVDHIVSNPPFFTNGLIAPNHTRALARHCGSLNFNSLLAVSKLILPNYGLLSFISPTDCYDEIIESAVSNQLNVSRITSVFSYRKDSKPIRLLWEMTPTSIDNTIKSNITIRDSINDYSQEYINLTKDFYLKF